MISRTAKIFSAITKKKAILIGGIFLSLFSYGCRDLESVRQLSQNWEVIDQTAKIIGDDFYESCLRSAKYPPEKKLGEKCREKYIPVSQNVINANLVLSKYLNQLFILADENTGSPENDLESLGSAVNNLVGALQAAFQEDNETTISLPNEDDINTGITILEYIFNFFANEFRYEELGLAIVCSNSSIQDYSNGLIALTEDTYYDGILKEEENDLDRYFANLTTIDLINPKLDENLELLSSLERIAFPAERIALPSERLAELELVNWTHEQYDKIEQRRKIARSYVALIKQIKTDHQNLADEFQQELELNKEDLNSSESGTSCNDYLREIKDKRKKEKVEISKKKTVEILLSLEKSMKNYKKIINQLEDDTLEYTLQK